MMGANLQLRSPLGLLLTWYGASAVYAKSCDASGGGSTYTGKYKSLGCYNDSMVSILSDAKVSTIAMTPQYCANFCGSRGYAYGTPEHDTEIQ